MHDGIFKKLRNLGLLLILFVGLKSCSTESRAITIHDNKELSIHSPLAYNASANSPKLTNWEGFYRGIIPCESCDGIEIELELRKPNRYKLTTIYMAEESVVLNNQGQFLWDNSGEMIILKNSTDDNNKFLLTQDHIKLLDAQGREYSSSLADLYTLRKIQK